MLPYDGPIPKRRRPLKKFRLLKRRGVMILIAFLVLASLIFLFDKPPKAIDRSHSHNHGPPPVRNRNLPTHKVPIPQPHTHSPLPPRAPVPHITEPGTAPPQVAVPVQAEPTPEPDTTPQFEPFRDPTPPGKEDPRRKAVRDAFEHAWGGYERYAFGFDELRPVANSGMNWLGGLGATIVDSLDTMAIMGLERPLAKARAWIAEHLNFDADVWVSTFETTIRVLGGLLSAYDLTGDELYIDKAADLGERLLWAFNTSTNIPLSSVNLRTHDYRSPSWNGGAAILSEAGTVQLEFRVLADRTGNPSFAEKPDAAMERLISMRPPKAGLYPVFINAERASFTNSHVTWGALGDSFYEYLLKLWIYSGRKESNMWKAYQTSVRATQKHLVFKTKPSDLVYIAEMQGTSPDHKMDHLVCFAGGLFALGAYAHHDYDQAQTSAAKDLADQLKLGADVTRTCYEMYHRMPTGIAPEFVRFRDGADMEAGAVHNKLRPETVESLMILHRVTGDPIYQEWGWEMFQSFERECRTSSGYSGLTTVMSSGMKNDEQPSYFLAETLKYFYLLFSGPDVIPLDEYVFNTEAHPFLIAH